MDIDFVSAVELAETPGFTACALALQEEAEVDELKKAISFDLNAYEELWQTGRAHFIRARDAEGTLQGLAVVLRVEVPRRAGHSLILDVIYARRRSGAGPAIMNTLHSLAHGTALFATAPIGGRMSRLLSRSNRWRQTHEVYVARN